ncbi:MAG: N-acetylmuramoyl-L-alanine amidase [Bdellovibrionales bacterium]|nr:N-acetylmuramoyl-L-alanine amidase [Bdellovibrionales bacterium]
MSLPFPLQADYSIVVDPAYGGPYKGLSYGPRHESDILLELARSIQKSWGKQKQNPLTITRLGDYEMSLDQRRAMVNSKDRAIFLHLSLAHRKKNPDPWVRIHVHKPDQPTKESVLIPLEKVSEIYLDGSIALASEMALSLPSNGQSGQVMISSLPLAPLIGIAAPAVALEIFLTPSSYDPNFDLSMQIQQLSQKILLALDLFVEKGIFRRHEKKRRQRNS